MQLGDMKVDKGRIIKVNPGEKVYRQRLVAMGLIPGTEFVVLEDCAAGDPVDIRVRGFASGLRKHEASILQIEGVVSEFNNRLGWKS